MPLIPAGGMPGWRCDQPDLPFISLQTALRLRPRRALSSAEATEEATAIRSTGNRATALFRF